MFDKYKLEYEMKSKGVSVDDLCVGIGMSKSAFYRKMKGATEFTRTEIQGITNFLHLETPLDIFFAKEVS